jgi:hypothetical protein
VPSQDDFHAENPQTNSWLSESDDSSQNSATTRASSPGSSGAPAVSHTEQAAKIQQLAASLGMDAEDLAKRIPEDTLRRLKFPAMEQTDPATGLSTFKHDVGIVRDHRIPLVASDPAHEAIPKGSNGRGAGTSTGRSEITGRFTK